MKVENLKYKLFLDDVRHPKYGTGWILALSFQNAREIVENFGAPKHISFDHDLGEESDGDGIDFAKWLIDYDMRHDVLGEEFTFNVHSANPVGAENITCLMNNYLKFKYGEENGKGE